jgi:hypothetical protein
MSRRIISGKRNAAYQMADYVLSGGHERDNLLLTLRTKILDTGRKDLREIAYSHVWHAAYSSLYGYREAQKEVTQLINEVRNDC